MFVPLLGAELEQDDDKSEVAEKVPPVPGGRVISHRDRQPDPRLVEDQEVQKTDDRSRGAVSEPLVADDLGCAERVEQELYARLLICPRAASAS